MLRGARWRRAPGGRAVHGSEASHAARVVCPLRERAAVAKASLVVGELPTHSYGAQSLRRCRNDVQVHVRRSQACNKAGGAGLPPGLGSTSEMSVADWLIVAGDELNKSADPEDADAEGGSVEGGPAEAPTGDTETGSLVDAVANFASTA
eukprot:scaffold1349_cov224-Prasinococcus_capsulatus_cf.AAC.2